MPDRDPTDVSRELNSARLERLAGSKALKDALQKEVETRLAYDSALIRHDIAIYHEAKDASERIPGADNRKSLAQARILQSTPELYADHLRAKANVEAIKARLKGLEYSIDALRSELSSLRAEFTHA